MATATKKRPKKRLKQGFLKGMKPPTIKELDSAAENYVEARDGRGIAQKAEISARDLVLAIMHKHNLKHYEYDGKTIDVVLDTKEKIKVKVKKDPDDYEDNGDDDGDDDDGDEE